MTEAKVFNNLRDANVARDKHWDHEGRINSDFRIVELAGEVGELCNLIKKLWREAKGLPGSRATTDQLTEELADVVICIDLVLMSRKKAPVCVKKFIPQTCDIDSVMGSARELVSDIGAFSDGSLDAGRWLLAGTHVIAAMFAIDIDAAVAAKFNATSEKVGLPVRLKYDG